MPTADPVLTTLAALVDHERWSAAPPAYRGDGCPEVRPLDSGILWRWHVDLGRWLPDPDDHATGGVLLSLVASARPELDVALDGGGLWIVCWDGGGASGPTLGRACVAALAAAWDADV